MSTEEKELEVTSTEAPKKPARKPRKPVDPAVWEELKAMQESGEVLTVKINAACQCRCHLLRKGCSRIYSRFYYPSLMSKI